MTKTRMTKTRTALWGVPAMAAGLLLLSLGAARGQQAVVPGRSVGRIFLGMPRADVWKILRPPTRRRTLPSSAIPAPHPPGRYAVDLWVDQPETFEHSLTVVSCNARVIQVEVNSASFAAPGGVSVAAPFAVLRRRFPRMRVDQYVGTTNDDPFRAILYYADDVQGGIAFTLYEQDDEVAYQQLPTLKPEDLIVHLPGRRALPVDADPTGHFSVEPRDKDDYLAGIRDWFAGGPHPKRHKG